MRVTLLYVALACAWILGSDWLVAQLATSQEVQSQLSVLKGWAFVAVTGVYLYAMLRRPGVSRHATPAPPSDAAATPALRELLVPWIVAALAIAVLSAGAIAAYLHQAREREAARIEAIAQLRVAQIERWLQEQARGAEFIGTSTLFAELHRTWREDKVPAAGEALLKRLVDFRKTNDYDDVQVLASDGSTLLAETPRAGPTPPALRDAVLQAIAARAPVISASYVPRDVAVSEGTRFAVVVPLYKTGEPPRAAIALRIDPRTFLLPTLHQWPIPSKSGTSLLVRREGDAVVGMAARNPRPVGGEDLLAGRAIRGDVPFGKVAPARDFRGVQVLGTVTPVHGTDWYLVTKIDQSEIVGGAVDGIAWIVATGVLAFLGVAVGLYLWRDRHGLRLALVQHAEQAKTARALHLLDAIADSSPDAIYAKDREGRYLLFNRGAAHSIGRTRDAVIGRTDALIAQKMEEQPDFKTEFDAAKAEIRAQLGLK